MLEKELSFADLSISLSELYEAMGYADAVPDEAVEKEVRGVLGRVEAVTSPRFCFFISGGELDESKDSLSVGDTCFSIGKIITRQLRGSESFAFFAATAGTGFERFQHTLLQEGDMVKVYIADAIGSVIAEKTADCMEIALDEYIRDRGVEAYESFQSRILRLACVGAKEIISLISFSGTLWHPVDRFQFDASYKIGQWSNRAGGWCP